MWLKKIIDGNYSADNFHTCSRCFSNKSRALHKLKSPCEVRTPPTYLLHLEITLQGHERMHASKPHATSLASFRLFPYTQPLHLLHCSYSHTPFPTCTTWRSHLCAVHRPCVCVCVCVYMTVHRLNITTIVQSVHCTCACTDCAWLTHHGNEISGVLLSMVVSCHGDTDYLQCM